MTGPLPDLLLPIATPMSWAYRQVISIRNARFDRGVGVGKVNVPVISIGNLTTGGVGKTPMVMWLAQHLLELVHRPAVAMRGYGGTRDEPADEVLEYQHVLPAVPLIVHPDRLTACREFLVEHPETTALLLDDGFQHRRLHRDLDIVLVDASRQTLHDRLLPAGHLREPPGNLVRADAVIVMRATSVDQTLARQIERYHAKPPLAWARHVWSSLHCYETSTDYRDLDVSWLEGKRVVTLLGVGHPESILKQLKAAGATVVSNVPAGDHERFSQQKLRHVREQCVRADALFMTRKDWVKASKLLDLTHWPAPVAVPALSIDVFEGREALESLVEKTLRGEES